MSEAKMLRPKMCDAKMLRPKYGAKNAVLPS